jgi:hypothetical protein
MMYIYLHKDKRNQGGKGCIQQFFLRRRFEERANSLEASDHAGALGSEVKFETSKCPDLATYAQAYEDLAII